jgi:hypothetical protein
MAQELPDSGAPFKIFILEKTIHVRKRWFSTTFSLTNSP